MQQVLKSLSFVTFVYGLMKDVSITSTVILLKSDFSAPEVQIILNEWDGVSILNSLPHQILKRDYFIYQTNEIATCLFHESLILALKSPVNRTGEMDFKVGGLWPPWLSDKKNFWILDALEWLNNNILTLVTAFW